MRAGIDAAPVRPHDADQMMCSSAASVIPSTLTGLRLRQKGGDGQESMTVAERTGHQCCAQGEPLRHSSRALYAGFGGNTNLPIIALDRTYGLFATIAASRGVLHPARPAVV